MTQPLSLLFYAGFSLPGHLRECLLNWAWEVTSKRKAYTLNPDRSRTDIL